LTYKGKRTLGYLLVLTVLLSALIPLQVFAQAEETYYLLATHAGIPYWLDHKRGAEAAAQDLGVNLEYVGAYGNDAEEQFNQLEALIGKHPAGILIGPVRPEALTPAINNAIAEGIPVITVVTDSPDSDRLCYIGPSGYDAGQLAADYMAGLLGTGEHYVGISNLVGVYVCDQRAQGFEDGIQERYPNIHVVGVVNDDCDYEVGSNACSDLLVANPNIDGMLGTNAASAVGIAAAVAAVNKTGQVRVIGWDNDSPTLNLIREGKVDASIVHNSFLMSYMAVQMLYLYNHNIGKLTEGGDWSHFLTQGLPCPWPTRINFPAMFCTIDDVADFER